MGQIRLSSASAAVCLFCILFGAGLAFGAIDIPDKLKDIPLYQGYQSYTGGQHGKPCHDRSFCQGEG